LAFLTLAILGCASGPAAPRPPQANADNSDYDPWLFKWLTGRGGKPVEATDAARPADAAAATGTTASTQRTSATMPAEPSAPLVPGPAANRREWPSASGPKFPSLNDSPAGPPPTIPAELPPPPSSAVSVGAMLPKDGEKEKNEKKSGFAWEDLAPENIYKNAKSAAGYGPDEKIARAAMNEGRKLFEEKKYKEAAEKFAQAAARWPDSPLEEDALFLEGESCFFSDRYPKAHDIYGGLLKKYSNTRHLDTVMAREFALGRYWEQKYTAKPVWPIVPNVTDSERPLFVTFGYAVQAYQRIRMYDPTGPRADDSLMALGNAYFRRGQYEDAAYHYDLLRKEYPNSKYQADAHVLGLQAKMRMYQGSAYDETPLKDGEKIADAALNQFNDKLGEERKRVAEARAQIVEERANREFIHAQYYEQRQCYGAARTYYRNVIKEFPGTQVAKQAEERLAAIADLPAEPPQRFAWLTGLFESKKK
jgi:TolA-binding protein